ncbi:hypothetical protein KC330_g8202 [Hortaea werneckii]|nr:hypothetical protein KC330_g8202 [Hortaea werneckii]
MKDKRNKRAIRNYENTYEGPSPKVQALLNELKQSAATPIPEELGRRYEVGDMELRDYIRRHLTENPLRIPLIRVKPANFTHQANAYPD